MCIPSELSSCLKALKHIDVVSPNHNELCGFFDKRGDLESGNVNKEEIEQSCRIWLDDGVGSDGNGLVIVRAGVAGCLVASRERHTWMPAYHTDSNRVKDPTGGGNAFLGGLAVALVRKQRSSQLGYGEEAAAWGSVAASFAIEQVGMPALERLDGKESWNGVDVFERLEEYKRRLHP